MTQEIFYVCSEHHNGICLQNCYHYKNFVSFFHRVVTENLTYEDETYAKLQTFLLSEEKAEQKNDIFRYCFRCHMLSEQIQCSLCFQNMLPTLILEKTKMNLDETKVGFFSKTFSSLRNCYNRTDSGGVTFFTLADGGEWSLIAEKGHLNVVCSTCTFPLIGNEQTCTGCGSSNHQRLVYCECSGKPSWTEETFCSICFSRFLPLIQGTFRESKKRKAFPHVSTPEDIEYTFENDASATSGFHSSVPLLTTFPSLPISYPLTFEASDFSFSEKQDVEFQTELAVAMSMSIEGKKIVPHNSSRNERIFVEKVVVDPIGPFWCWNCERLNSRDRKPLYSHGWNRFRMICVYCERERRGVWKCTECGRWNQVLPATSKFLPHTCENGECQSQTQNITIHYTDGLIHLSSWEERSIIERKMTLLDQEKRHSEHSLAFLPLLEEDVTPKVSIKERLAQLDNREFDGFAISTEELLELFCEIDKTTFVQQLGMSFIMKKKIPFTFRTDQGDLLSLWPRIHLTFFYDPQILPLALFWAQHNFPKVLLQEILFFFAFTTEKEKPIREWIDHLYICYENDQKENRALGILLSSFISHSHEIVSGYLDRVFIPKETVAVDPLVSSFQIPSDHT